MEMSHTQFQSELLKLANSIDETVKAIKEAPLAEPIMKVAAQAPDFRMGDLSDRPASGSGNPFLDFLQS